MRSSSLTTIAASSMSWWRSASSTRSRAVTTMSRAPSAWTSSAWSSSRKCARALPAIGLAELPRHVLLRPGVARVREDRVGLGELDELAAEHERGLVGHARRLLHVVGDDHDRVVALELVDELLDLERRDRVERRAGLVHQDHLGLDGDRARDAEPLLLAAGEADARRAEAVLDLLPESGAAQRAL